MHTHKYIRIHTVTFVLLSVFVRVTVSDLAPLRRGESFCRWLACWAHEKQQHPHQTETANSDGGSKNDESTRH